MKLRLHQIEYQSRANGPGCRAVFWVQGCALGCPQCFNPGTHDSKGGFEVEVGELVETLRTLEPSLEGLTLSGGEPLQQLPAVLELLREVRAATQLSVILLTGFTWEEVSRLNTRGGSWSNGRRSDSTRYPPPFHSLADVVIAGRYEASRHMARGLRGSSNKTVHFLTERYSPRDLAETPEGEVFITAEGSLQLSGIAPLAYYERV